jgi:hypothetical protein
MINSNGNKRPKPAFSLCVERLEGRVVLSGVRHAADHHPGVVASHAERATAAAAHHADSVAAAAGKSAAARAQRAAAVEAMSQRNAQRNPGAPPTTIESHLIGNGHTVTGVVITFSKPLNPATAQDPKNYVVTLPYRPSPDPADHTPVPKAAIRSVVYDPNQDAVTLYLAQPFPFPPTTGTSSQSEDIGISSPIGPDPRYPGQNDTISISTITDMSGQRLSPGTTKGERTPDGSLALSIYGWDSVPNPDDAWSYTSAHGGILHGKTWNPLPGTIGLLI